MSESCLEGDFDCGVPAPTVSPFPSILPFPLPTAVPIPVPTPLPTPEPTIPPSPAPSRQDWLFPSAGSLSHSFSYADCSSDCPPEFFAVVANGEKAFCDEVAATGNGIFSCLSDCLDHAEDYVAMHCACGSK